MEEWEGKSMESKACNACQKIIPLDLFHLNPKHPEGRHRTCKQCRRNETRKRYVKYKTKIDTYNSVWQRQHKIRKRVITQRNRCKQLGISGNVSYRDWKEVLITQNFLCRLCGKAGNLEMDHIEPISLGGKHERSNIQALCKLCNVRKGYYFGEEEFWS